MRENTFVGMHRSIGDGELIVPAGLDSQKT